MIECHWNSFNTFEHYGSGGFDMKGWDALNTGTLPLFHFKEIDAERMREELLAHISHINPAGRAVLSNRTT